MLSASLLDAIFVTVPALRVEERGDAVWIANPAAGTGAAFGREILNLLDHFATPRALRSWLDRSGVSARNIPTAISHAFLTDVDRLAVAPPDPIGAPLSVTQLLAAPRAGETVLFSAPTDTGSSGRGGARAGPAEIRRHLRLPQARDGDALLDFEMRRHYPGPLPRIGDLGSVAGLTGEGTSTYGARITLLTDLILAQGAVPALLGGDHSCTAFALEAHLRHWPALGILHFDAHHDLWPPAAAQYDYVTHANVFHRALAAPSLRVLRQFGLRVFEAVPARRLAPNPRVDYRSARELQKLSPEQAFAGLPRDIPYYLSFDIDCIDPAYAPETGTPLPGGLSYHQALDLVDFAARNFRLVGWDIVEVGQAERPVNGAALCAARLVRELLFAGMPFEALDAYTQPAPAAAHQAEASACAA